MSVYLFVCMPVCPSVCIYICVSLCVLSQPIQKIFAENTCITLSIANIHKKLGILVYFLRLPRRGSSNGSLDCFNFPFGLVTGMLLAAPVVVLAT